mgnify:FL=1
MLLRYPTQLEKIGLTDLVFSLQLRSNFLLSADEDGRLSFEL